MKKNLILSFTLMIFCFYGMTQVISDFESGNTDGWQSEGDGNSYWEAGTGNPGGCFRVDDDATGNMNRAFAPVKFLGDWSSATATDYVSADIFLHQINGGYVPSNFVFRIVGPGGSAKAIINPSPPYDEWITFSASLIASAWTVESGSWNSILQHVSKFIVTMEYINGDEYNRLDNVTLSLSPVTVPLQPVICADFESGLFEGWSFVNTGNVTMKSTGGNPGGYVSINDALGVLSVAVPPSNFHGDWSDLDENAAQIRIDVNISGFTGPLALPAYFIKISGPGGEAVFLCDESIMNAFNAWFSFGIPINQADWTMLSGDWSALLEFITNIQIATEFISGTEVVGIDNFCITNLPPETDFMVDKTVAFDEDVIHFSDKTGGGAVSWSWDFGDGTGSTEINPLHQYSTPGTYSPSLTTGNLFGSDTELKTDLITILPVDQCLKLEDSFDDNSISELWTLTNGTWSEANGNIRQTSNYYTTNDYLGGCYSITGSQSWSDYVMFFDMMSSDDDYIGAVFNYQDESNMYMFRWSQQASDRKLSKYVNGVETVLESDAEAYTSNVWYGLEISTVSGDIVVSIDGSTVFSVADNTFSSGKAGLYCWGNQSSYWDNISVECPRTPIDLTVFLEGAFNGTDMNTGLVDGDFIPPANPFSDAPWNYPGDETIVDWTDIAVDWVLVDLRDALTAEEATASTSVGKQAALLLNNGKVVTPYGGKPLHLDQEIINNLFVCIYHRNHLGVMSAVPLTENGGAYTFDFTSGPGQAYGTDAQQDLGGGVFGMYAGDIDASGGIDALDAELWSSQAGKRGYIQNDLDLDGQGDNVDKNDWLIGSQGKNSQIPE